MSKISSRDTATGLLKALSEDPNFFDLEIALVNSITMLNAQGEVLSLEEAYKAKHKLVRRLEKKLIMCSRGTIFHE